MSNDARRMRTITPTQRRKLKTMTGRPYGNAADVYEDPEAEEALKKLESDDDVDDAIPEQHFRSLSRAIN